MEYVSRSINRDYENNSKRFYTYIRNKRTDNNGVAPLEEDGQLKTSNKDKANILNRQFVSVFTKNTDRELPVLGPPVCDTMPEFQINVSGVNKLLDNLRPNKASGPDNIQARFLRVTSDQLSPALTLIFRASLKQGVVPTDWRHARVAPLYKAGKSNRSKAVNYRPVSLTCICSKVMEHIVCSSLMSHLDDHKILTDFQCGFRKKRSCETQLLTTINSLAKSLDKGRQIDCILLDFSKAFDKVSHARLLLKLKHYGVRGKTLNWIKAFLENRTQEVVVKGESSDIAAVTSGVPQGTVLGPALFLVYINDLPQCVSSTPRLFADDCILYREISNHQDTVALQSDLFSLQNWEKMWLMEFAEEKCKVLRITRKTSRNIILHDYNIHGHSLESVKEGKYLGVTLQDKLSFTPHVNSTIKKAASIRQFLQRNLRGCSREVKETSYKTFIRPVLEYASTAWDPVGKSTLRQSLEAEQNRAARFVVGDFRRSSSIGAILNQLQWQSLAERRARARVVMIYKILNDLVSMPRDFLAMSPAPSVTRGAAHKLLIPQARTDTYRTGFVVSSSMLWNRLPPAVTQAGSINSLRGQLALVSLA